MRMAPASRLDNGAMDLGPLPASGVLTQAAVLLELQHGTHVLRDNLRMSAGGAKLRARAFRSH